VSVRLHCRGINNEGIRDLGGKIWSHRDEPSEVANIFRITSFVKKYKWMNKIGHSDLPLPLCPNHKKQLQGSER
jgi:hypothetical protein